MPKIWNRRDPACPADAVYVGRPTKFGNPFSHDSRLKERRDVRPVATREEAVMLYREQVAPRLAHDARQLRGKDLVCWCVPFGGIEWAPNHPLKDTCHCFPLMEVANA